jgi:hypothetical protein
MMTKTLLATAAAAVIAAGTMGLATTTAEAGYHGPNVVIGFGHPYGYGYGYGYGYVPPPPPVCKPIVKNVVWYDWKGKKHWSKKVVGNTCGGPVHPYAYPY